MKIKEISENMFIRGEEHISRLEMLGKRLADKTIEQKRQLMDLITKHFGEEELETVSSSTVLKFLFKLGDERSSSWKNRFLEVFKELYTEYVWKTDCEITVPKFPRFSNNSKKADVFTTEELQLFFDNKLWKNFSSFLFFYITVNCGLRLGEARGLKVKQFNFNEHILVIDGFIRSDGTRTTFNKSGSLRDKKNRVVFIPKEVEKQVQKYILNRNLSTDDFLFVRKGKPFRQEFCEHLFHKMLVKTKIDTRDRKLTPHSLRYTYVTRMRRYISGDIVRILAGHTSQEMTDYYTKPMIEDMLKWIEPSRDAAEKLFS